jgi:hypothetical protein
MYYYKARNSNTEMLCGQLLLDKITTTRGASVISN